MEDPKTVKRIVEEDWQQMPYIKFFEVSICSDILLLFKHCELVFYIVLQDLFCLMFLLLLKRPIADTFSLTFTLHDGIRVTHFHVDRVPQVALVVGSRIQLFVKRR